jgi:hypothetical protein
MKSLIDNINGCYEEHYLIIHLFQGINFLYLQIWCIPGAILFNILAGAVFGIWNATIICLVVSFLHKFIFIF